jgi:hypothetical protein
MNARGLVTLALLAASAVGSTGGCALHAHPEPVGYVEVTSAPAGIETYPSTYYDGRPVYLYQDRWYYRDGRRWGYYRQEPPVLYEHRMRVRGRPGRGPAPAPSYRPEYRERR